MGDKANQDRRDTSFERAVQHAQLKASWEPTKQDLQVRRLVEQGWQIDMSRTCVYLSKKLTSGARLYCNVDETGEIR